MIPPLTEYLDGSTVLIVDDVGAQRRSLRDWFANSGAAVIEASTGSEAMALVRELPDLVIIDAQVDGLPGVDVVHRLKSDPLTAEIPVIQRSTGPIGDEEVVDGLQRGADAYLIEPVSKRVLVATANAILRTQDLARRLEVALSTGDSGVFDWSVSTGKVRWNESLELMHGMEPGSFGGGLDDFFASLHPDDADRIAAELQSALASDDVFALEFRFVRADRSVGHMDGRGRIFRDAAGTPVRVLGLAQDVSRRVSQRLQVEQLRRLASQLSGLRTSSGVLAALDAELNHTNVTIRIVEADDAPSARVVFSFALDDRRLEVEWFERHDAVTRRQAIAIGELAGSAIDRALRFESERTNAEILQRALQPAGTPSVDGYRLDACYVPAVRSDRLGGDFFDVLEFEDVFVVAVGDVAGHGLDATRQMGEIRSMIRTIAAGRSGDPVSTVRECRLLYHDVCGLDCPFSTAVICLLEKSTGRTTVVSAGHPPPLTGTATGSARLLELVPGPPLGVAAPIETSAVDIVLGPGEWIALYTDGVFERRDRPFDVAVREAVASSTGAPTAQQLIDLGASAPGLTPDDRVVLVVQRNPT